MRRALFVCGGYLACIALGCGSSDDSKGGSGGSSGATTAQAGASAGSPSASAGSSGSNAVAGSNAGGAAAGASASSAACQTYCECHEKNCATTAIPGGLTCAAFCAGMTKDQLDCRQVMCVLVPAQPDNDHCTHSVGINQCM